MYAASVWESYQSVIKPPIGPPRPIPSYTVFNKACFHSISSTYSIEDSTYTLNVASVLSKKEVVAVGLLQSPKEIRRTYPHTVHVASYDPDCEVSMSVNFIVQMPWHLRSCRKDASAPHARNLRWTASGWRVVKQSQTWKKGDPQTEKWWASA